MTNAEKLAAFVTRATWSDLSDSARISIEMRVGGARLCDGRLEQPDRLATRTTPRSSAAKERAP